MLSYGILTKMFTEVSSKSVQGTFLIFTDKGYYKVGGKTKVYSVINKNGLFLGNIQWFNHWRQYCFFPVDCILNETCMQEIAAFLKVINTRQRKDWMCKSLSYRKRGYNKDGSKKGSKEAESSWQEV